MSGIQGNPLEGQYFVGGIPATLSIRRPGVISTGIVIAMDVLMLDSQGEIKKINCLIMKSTKKKKNNKVRFKDKNVLIL